MPRTKEQIEAGDWGNRARVRDAMRLQLNGVRDMDTYPIVDQLVRCDPREPHFDLRYASAEEQNLYSQ